MTITKAAYQVALKEFNLGKETVNKQTDPSVKGRYQRTFDQKDSTKLVQNYAATHINAFLRGILARSKEHLKTAKQENAGIALRKLTLNPKSSKAKIAKNVALKTLKVVAATSAVTLGGAFLADQACSTVLQDYQAQCETAQGVTAPVLALATAVTEGIASLFATPVEAEPTFVESILSHVGL